MLLWLRRVPRYNAFLTLVFGTWYSTGRAARRRGRDADRTAAVRLTPYSGQWPSRLNTPFKYQTGTSGLEGLKPVWLDIDQCGDSEYSIPAGASDTHWDWNVNVPGRIVAIGGHVHTEGHGVRIEATNQTTGQSICNSVGAYGQSADYIDMMGEPWLSSMSRCIANPVATVASGNRVRIHSIYNSPDARNDVMGIMVAFIDQ